MRARARPRNALVSDDFETGMLSPYHARHIINPSAAEVDPDAELDALMQAQWDHLRTYFVDEAFDESARPTFLPYPLFSVISAGREFLREPLRGAPYVEGTPIEPP